MSIVDICSKYNIKNYIIREDGKVDVNGNVKIANINITKLPLKFGVVTGWFYCSNCYLTTLEDAPEYVGGDFDCSGNNLIKLDFNTKYVGGDFDCGWNSLTSIKCKLEYVGGDFICEQNKIKSLKGLDKIKGFRSLDCNNNKLKTLYYTPYKLNGYLDCTHNMLTSMIGCPKYIEEDLFMSYNDIFSLKYFPKKIGKEFFCNNTPLNEVIVNINKNEHDFEYLIEFLECDIIRKENSSYYIISDILDDFLENNNMHSFNYDSTYFRKYYTVI